MKHNKKLKLTTRGRYAVMAMVVLGQRDGKNPVPLVEIAETGDISLSYLEQLFAGLRKHNLVKSYRGPGGGYVLSRPANDISIADILESAEDCAPARRSTRDQDSHSVEYPQTKALWSTIGSFLYVSLRHVSLEDVMANRIESHQTLNKAFEILS